MAKNRGIYPPPERAAEMAKLKAIWRDLPEGSFASVGTYMNTIVMRVTNDGKRNWW